MSADDEHHRRAGARSAGHRRRRCTLLALIVATLVMAAASGGAAAAPAFTWSPQLLYSPGWPEMSFVQLGFADVSCAAPSLCVAVSLDGQVQATTDLAGGPAAWTARTLTAPGEWLRAVSCAAATLCVVGGDAGRVLASVDAGSPTPTWRQVATAPDAIYAISCATVSFCVAVDASGDVLSSPAPAEPGSWRTVPVDGVGAPLSAVSCPSAGLCVALDEADQLLTSRAPGGGPGSWAIELLPGAPTFLVALTCASSSLCLVLDVKGNAYVSNAPAQGAQSWREIGSVGAWAPIDVTCTSEERCLVLSPRDVTTSDLPLEGASAWSTTPLGDELDLTGTACLSATRCVLVSHSGYVIVGDAPPPLGSVRVTLFGEGEGTIVAPGLACTTTCDGSYVRGTRLTLTPAAGVGSVFGGWGGACQGLDPCEITIAPETTLTAGFAPAPSPPGFRLSVSIGGDGSVRGGGIDCPDACVSTRPPGTVDELMAAARPGWHLDAWFGACEGRRRCRLTAGRDHAVSAQFAPGAVEILDARIRAAAGRARFAFRGSLPGVGTRCALVRLGHSGGRRRQRWRACRSPVAYAHLAPGRYVFSARAARAGDPATRWPFRVR